MMWLPVVAFMLVWFLGICAFWREASRAGERDWQVRFMICIWLPSILVVGVWALLRKCCRALVKGCQP